MVKVILGRYWRPEFVEYAPGDEVEVSEDVAAWLRSCGALAESRRVVEPVVSRAEFVPEIEAEPVDEPEPESVGDGVARPRKAATLDAWRKYAEAVGVSHKGLSKQEIIAAVG